MFRSIGMLGVLGLVCAVALGCGSSDDGDGPGGSGGSGGTAGSGGGAGSGGTAGTGGAGGQGGMAGMGGAGGQGGMAGMGGAGGQGGMAGMGGAGGQGGMAGMGGSPANVIGTGSGVSDWRALPKICDVGVFDATAFSFDCTTPRTPPEDLPNGGTANAFCSGTPSGCPYAGCAVPSATLAGQLAVDVFIEVSVASSGDGNLTHNYTVTAVNAALGIAAAIANLVDITVFTDVTSADPAQVVNILDPAFANTTLGLYVQGGTTLVLDNEIPSVTTAVTPTSSPNVNINFSGEFLLELFLTTAMAPLDVDSSNCTFDLPGPDIILPVVSP